MTEPKLSRRESLYGESIGCRPKPKKAELKPDEVKFDYIENTIIVNCPIKDRNYKGNPSLRVKIDVIKEARLRGKYTWYNRENDPFTAFKPLEFDKIFIEPINSFDIKNFKNRKYSQNFLENKLSKGPAPRTKGYTISTANPCAFICHIDSCINFVWKPNENLSVSFFAYATPNAIFPALNF